VLGTWRAARHWDLSAGYLFADLPQSSAVAHVPLAIVTPHLAAGRWSFADANRAERLLDYSDEPYRYRNRAAVDCAVGRERRTHVYVANEVILEVAPRTAWNQNRAQLGVGFAAGKRTRADVYVLQRSAPGSKETTVTGTVLTVTLGKKG
jgi:hypothetical protein